MCPRILCFPFLRIRRQPREFVFPLKLVFPLKHPPPVPLPPRTFPVVFVHLYGENSRTISLCGLMVAGLGTTLSFRRILTACVNSVTARCCSANLGFDAIFHASEATLLHSLHLKLLLIIINNLATLFFIPFTHNIIHFYT